MSGSGGFARVALGASIAAVSAGCFELTDPLPPGERKVLVHAVLEVGAPFHIVTVERTGDGGTGSAEPVDAQVALILPDGTKLLFAQGNPGLYHYMVPMGLAEPPVAPGATYTLRIETAAGEVVTGTTTIPASEAAAPDTSTYVPFDMMRDTLRLSWPRVPGAKSYHVSIMAREPSFAPGVRVRYDTRHAVFTDTSITLPGNLRVIDDGDVFQPGDSLAVVVSAVDDNYYTYYHGSLDPFAGAPPSRLSGGIGVFGSIVPLINRRYRVLAPNN